MGESTEHTDRRSVERAPSLDQAHLLVELGRAVTSSLDLQEVLDTSFQALRRLVSFGGGSIQLIDDGALVPVATEPPMTDEAKRVRIPVGKGISGTIAATAESIYIPDITTDPRVPPPATRKGVTPGVRSYFGIPLIMHGDAAGVLQIDSEEVDAFPPDARACVLMLAPTIAAAVQNALLFDRERAALQQLQDTQQQQRDFVAIVSHELRTPITSVSGFGLTLAEHANDLERDTISNIGFRIWRASRRLERMMGDLLDLSHIERGTLAAFPTPTNIEPILRQSVSEQSTDTHPIVLNLQEPLPKAMVDGERLHQIIGNLLSNARKFSPTSTAIEVVARAEGGAIALTVEDHGKGIPDDLITRVFDRFVQGEAATTRSADGLGIGLYLVKQLCDRMDATIEVDSTVGEGTRFTTRLP
ncbi:MAG TPA: GAF domain-containing sensor histidine kinase, partial [Actinomycetota bacterium]|nr:GAF domain-containing sensor histidine kinase [Actinomycetota bacterium]